LYQNEATTIRFYLDRTDDRSSHHRSPGRDCDPTIQQLYATHCNYTQRTKLAGALGGALAWKTAVGLCVAEEGALATCDGGSNGIPANFSGTSGNTVKYIDDITTASGIITIVTEAVNNTSVQLNLTGRSIKC